MEKVKLLNDGGYGNSKAFNFPVVVNAEKHLSRCGEHTGYLVSEHELANVGFSFEPVDGQELYFSLIEGECVAVDE